MLRRQTECQVWKRQELECQLWACRWEGTELRCLLGHIGHTTGAERPLSRRLVYGHWEPAVTLACQLCWERRPRHSAARTSDNTCLSDCWAGAPVVASQTLQSKQSTEQKEVWCKSKYVDQASQTEVDRGDWWSFYCLRTPWWAGFLTPSKVASC